MTEQTEIVEFKQSEAALAVLREKYTDIPDCATPDGYEECRVGIGELRTLRTTLDKARLALNLDDQKRIKFRNGEAKRITGELVKLEDPMKAAKAVIDEAKAKEEAEAAKKEEQRISAIEFRIGEMTAFETTHAGMSVDTIDGILQGLDTCYEDFDFQEFIEAAELERNRVRAILLKAMKTRKAFDEERAELEEKKIEMAKEQAKLDATKEAQEKKLAEKKAELDTQQAKVEQERKEAAAAMKAAQDKAQSIKYEEAAKKAAAEKAVKDKELAEAAEKKRKKDEELEAARQHALKPDKQKVHDWVAKLRFIDGPGGLDSLECRDLVADVMADLDKLVTGYIHILEEL